MTNDDGWETGRGAEAHGADGGTQSRHASGEAALRQAIRRWRSLRAESRCVDGVDVAPRCVHGTLVQQAVDDLRGDLQEVRKELEWVRRVIVAAIVTAGIGTLLRLGGLSQ